MTAAAQIEATFREEHGRVLAALISQFEDFDLAEDALQDALVNALERWQGDGIPENPGAWLTTVARRRASDRVRRSTTLERSLVILDPPISQGEPDMDDIKAKKTTLEKILKQLIKLNGQTSPNSSKEKTCPRNILRFTAHARTT
jgi:predicted RNA polymerase sigma factor